MRRLTLFLYSTRNLVGAVLALLGLGAYFAGLLGAWWLPIVVGLYLVGVFVTPARTVHEVRLERSMNADEVRAALDRLVRDTGRRLPREATERVRRIRESILEVLPRLDELAARGDPNAFMLRQTALDYLPATLENYLRLPPAYASVHPVQDGKTAKQLLLEQLDLLDRTMRDVVADLARGDADRLLVQGRFLNEKFGRPDFKL